MTFTDACVVRLHHLGACARRGALSLGVGGWLCFLALRGAWCSCGAGHGWREQLSDLDEGAVAQGVTDAEAAMAAAKTDTEKAEAQIGPDTYVAMRSALAMA